MSFELYICQNHSKMVAIGVPISNFLSVNFCKIPAVGIFSNSCCHYGSFIMRETGFFHLLDSTSFSLPPIPPPPCPVWPLRHQPNPMNYSFFYMNFERNSPIHWNCSSAQNIHDIKLIMFSFIYFWMPICDMKH